MMNKKILTNPFFAAALGVCGVLLVPYLRGLTTTESSRISQSPSKTSTPSSVPTFEAALSDVVIKQKRVARGAKPAPDASSDSANVNIAIKISPKPLLNQPIDTIKDRVGQFSLLGSDETILIIPERDQKIVESSYRDFPPNGLCEVRVREAYMPVRDDGKPVYYSATNGGSVDYRDGNGELKNFNTQWLSAPPCNVTPLDKMYHTAARWLGDRTDDHKRSGFLPSTLLLSFAGVAARKPSDGSTAMGPTLTCPPPQIIDNKRVFTCRDAKIQPILSVLPPLQPAP